MKILSLRLKNLNSLKGEWKIDFTAEPFGQQWPVRHYRRHRGRENHAARCHLPGALS